MNNELSTHVDNLITGASSGFASTLAQYKWDLLPDSQLQAAKKALTKSDYIMKIATADVDAVHDSLIQAAVLGLDLTEGKRQGWLLPRKNQQGKTVIVLQVGYKGVEAIHQRMGVIDRLSIRVVRENDSFEWSGDDQEKPKHEANWFDTDEQRGPISGAFAITYYPDGSINVTTASISEIYTKHRDVADSWKSYQAKLNEGKSAYPPPWAAHEKAMVEKTMAYIAAKQWPANIRDQGMSSKILETLHEVDVSDYNYKYTQEQKAAFHEFIEKNDALGLYLFSKRIDVEGYVALFNTFKKGTKMAMKETVRKMEEVGHGQLTHIIEAVDEKDSGKLLENLDGCLDVTIKMVKAKLDEHQKSTFAEIVDNIEAA